jgi:Protein of unknown function (DUF3303)
MLFMVIERFRDNDVIPIYQRLRDSGRSLPDGLEYIDSWVEPPPPYPPPLAGEGREGAFN